MDVGFCSEDCYEKGIDVDSTFSSYRIFYDKLSINDKFILFDVLNNYVIQEYVKDQFWDNLFDNDKEFQCILKLKEIEFKKQNIDKEAMKETEEFYKDLFNKS
jgi:hypothetical protein